MGIKLESAEGESPVSQVKEKVKDLIVSAT